MRKTALRRTSSLARRTPVKKRNAARRKSEFARCYHSKARVAFVKSLPCVACGKGPCENAHVENGGTGRKADYTLIVPLCSRRSHNGEHPPIGCHHRLHNLGVKTFEAQHRIDLHQEAARIEALWQQTVSQIEQQGRNDGEVSCG